METLSAFSEFENDAHQTAQSANNLARNQIYSAKPLPKQMHPFIRHILSSLRSDFTADLLERVYQEFGCILTYKQYVHAQQNNLNVIVEFKGQN